MHRHPRRTWAALLLYAAAATFPHQVVQYYVNEIAMRTTLPTLYLISAVIILVIGAILSVAVCIRLVRQEKRVLISSFWILTIGLIWCSWRFFTANNVELVHYPQYFPEGIVLFALTLSPVESLSWIALFGGLDECFQYWDLMGAKRVPYDFNDVYMDLLGGAAGILFAMAFFQYEQRRDTWKQLLRRPGVVALSSVVSVGLALWSCGLMQLYETNSPHWFALSRVKMPAFWFQVVANGPNKYHTLSPIEGPILMLLTIAFYAILDRKIGQPQLALIK
jgi:hypothetical protein